MLLQYDVGFIGFDKLDRGLKHIEQRFSSHNARVQTQARTARTGAAATGAQMAERARMTADIRTAAKLREIEAKKAAAIEVASFKSSAAAKLRSDQQALRSLETQRKTLAQQELARIRIEDRERQRSIRAADVAKRASIRAAAAEERKATREASVAQRFQAREAARASREYNRVLSGRKRFIGSVGRSIGSGIRSVGLMGGLALGAGATTLAVAGIADEAAAERNAAVIANNAVGQEGETRTGDQIASSIRETARAGVASGVSKEDTLRGLSNFSALSGRLALGEKMAPLITGVAQAYGADVGDVGSTAGRVAQAFLKKDPTMSSDALAKELQTIMLTLVSQAKVGSVEFKDFAQQMAKVAAVAGKSDAPLSDMIANIGALVQLSNGASPESMATSAVSLSRAITNKSSILESGRGSDGRKVKVFTDSSKQRQRNMIDIIMDMVSATRGNQAQLSHLTTGEAMPALEPFIQAYSEGTRGKKGAEADKAGRAAMEKLFGAMRVGPVSDKQFAEDRARPQNTTAGKFDIELGKLKDAIGAQLLPELNKLIPQFSRLTAEVGPLIPEVARVVGWFASNPFSGLGSLVALKVSMDLAGAGIGNVMSSGLARVLSGAAPQVGQTLAQGVLPVSAGLRGLIAPLGGLGGAIAATTAALGLAAVAVYEASKRHEHDGDKDLLSSNPDTIADKASALQKRVAQAKRGDESIPILERTRLARGEFSSAEVNTLAEADLLRSGGLEAVADYRKEQRRGLANGALVGLGGPTFAATASPESGAMSFDDARQKVTQVYAETSEQVSKGLTDEATRAAINENTKGMDRLTLALSRLKIGGGQGSGEPNRLAGPTTFFSPIKP